MLFENILFLFLKLKNYFLFWRIEKRFEKYLSK